MVREGFWKEVTLELSPDVERGDNKGKERARGW
jgi:hypothetical protein